MSDTTGAPKQLLFARPGGLAALTIASPTHRRCGVIINSPACQAAGTRLVPDPIVIYRRIIHAGPGAVKRATILDSAGGRRDTHRRREWGISIGVRCSPAQTTVHGSWLSARETLRVSSCRCGLVCR